MENGDNANYLVNEIEIIQFTSYLINY